MGRAIVQAARFTCHRCGYEHYAIPTEALPEHWVAVHFSCGQISPRHPSGVHREIRYFCPNCEAMFGTALDPKTCPDAGEH